MRRDVLNDPNLPHLRTVVDSEEMSRLFERHFAEDYPDRGFSVLSTEIEKVYYRIEKHCGVLHRVHLRDARGEESNHWFFVRHFNPGDSERRFEKGSRKAGPAVSFWKPVTHWPEVGMVIWAFPHDPRLTHLPEVVNPENVAKLVESNTESLGLEAGVRCGEVRCQQIKYMPGKRVVLRFEADLTQPDGSSRTLAFWSKTYGDQSSLYVYRAMEEARLAGVGGPGTMEIPRSTLHIDHLHTYWQEEWAGKSMSSYYGTEAMHDAVPNVAEALAKLHLTPLPSLSDAFYVSEVADEILEDAHKIARYLPEDRARVLKIAERIGAAGPGVTPRELPHVPIHGAFRMSQLLGNGGHLAMTDFDATALGDPHYDVAEFMSSLLYQEFRRSLPREELESLAQSFVEAYEKCVPWTLDRKRLAWFQSAFTLEKFHGTLKGLEKRVLECIDAVYELSERQITLAES